MKSVEAAENKVRAFEWIIRHLNDYDFSEEHLEEAVIEAVDELTEEFKNQKESLVSYLAAHKLALYTRLNSPR